MKNSKNVRISKYETIGKAIGETASTVCNYVTGVSTKATGKKAEIIRAASDFYDKELAAFKIKIAEGIKQEIEKIE